jgi:uridine kinase
MFELDCVQVMRDIQRSGQGAGEVIQQVSDTVYPMYKAFIEPDLEKAEIKVTNKFNPFAGFKEPIQILKTDDPVDIDAVHQCLHEMFPDNKITQVQYLSVQSCVGNDLAPDIGWANFASC